MSSDAAKSLRSRCGAGERREIATTFRRVGGGEGRGGEGRRGEGRLQRFAVSVGGRVGEGRGGEGRGGYNVSPCWWGGG